MLHLSLIFSALAFSQPSLATLTIGESAEIIPQNTYQLGLEPTFMTGDGEGFNMGVFGDLPINESSSARFGLGTGGLDVFLSGSYKFVPYPDLDSQPAIGGKVSVIYVKDQDVSQAIFRLAPIVSKKYPIDPGLITPYGSIPIMVTNTDSKTVVGTSLVAGTEFIHNDLKNFKFGTEISVDINDGFGYISLMVGMPFDEEFRFKGRGN